MTNSISRRDALKNIALAAGVVVGIQTAAAQTAAKPAAKPPVKLDEKDPVAAALGYVADASKVDKKKNPMFKVGHNCANCLQIQGKDGEAWRPCNLFPGKVVASKGWCKSWIQKPGTKV